MWRAWTTVLLVAVAASAGAAPAGAWQDVKARRVWISEAWQEDGQVVVPVEIDDLSGVVAIDLDLVFDSSALTVAEVRRTDLLGGFLLSLPGLYPALSLNWGTDPSITAQANEIYVFRRLAHHLVPGSIPRVLIDRFLLLTVLWLVLEWTTPGNVARRRLRTFVAGSLAIACAGVAISLLEYVSRPLAAGL